MRKCEICKTDEAIWAWQPYGPDESALYFVTLGSHTRGFIVVKICDACKGKLERGENVSFCYHSVWNYVVNGQIVNGGYVDEKNPNALRTR